MNILSKHIQTIIYSVSLVLAVVLYFGFDSLGFEKITQSYGIAAFVLLYFTLLATAICDVFPNIKNKNIYLQARKALGICTFFFSLYHGYFGFFGLVGGFSGLQNLSSNNTWSLAHGLIALVLLAVVAITSLPYLFNKIGISGKYIQGSMYVAGLFMLAHGVGLSTHLISLKSILFTTYVALLGIIGLDLVRLENYMTNKFAFIPKYAMSIIGFPIISFMLFKAFFVS